METRRLGTSDLSVSAVGLGTMNFGGRTDEASAREILDTAVEHGINLIDTANVYGHDPGDFTTGRGRSEEIIGRWLRSSGHRERIIVATKVFFPMREAHDATGATAANIRRECEASLRRLGVDAIDLYQLHHPSNDIPIDETLAAMDELVRAGKVRHIGTSSFAAWQLMESLWVGDLHRWCPPVSEQPVYNLLDRRIERELAGMAETYGIGLLTWSPLAGGALAGTYRRGRAAPAGSRFDRFWRGHDRELTDPVHDVIDEVRRLAAARGVSSAEFAHAWVMGSEVATAVLVGPRTVDQLVTSLAGTRLVLDDDERRAIDAIAPPGRCVLPQYGADGLAWHPWGPHRVPWRGPARDPAGE